MPNVGWGELLLILLVALVVFGPRRLPEMMRSLGKGLRAFQDESQRAVDQFRVATTDEGGSEHGVVDRPDGWVPGAAPEVEEASANGAGTTRRGTGARARSSSPRASSRTTRAGSGSAKKASARSATKRATPKRSAPKRSASTRASSGASSGTKRSVPAKRTSSARTKRTAPREPYEDT